MATTREPTKKALNAAKKLRHTAKSMRKRLSENVATNEKFDAAKSSVDSTFFLPPEKIDEAKRPKWNSTKMDDKKMK